MADLKSTAPPNLKDVPRSRVFYEPVSLPSRADYIQYLITHGHIAREEDLVERPDLIVAIQQDWHRQGQNGCKFAQFIVQKRSEHGWETAVFVMGKAPWPRQAVEDVGDTVADAIRDPGINAVSLVFPDVRVVERLCSLITALGQRPGWRVDELEQYASLPERPPVVALAVRVRLNDQGALAWALGFGPFAFLPPTRQSPFTEIALASKPKRGPVREGLTPDQLAAHLADIPVRLNKQSFDSMMVKTKANRRMILAGVDDPTAKAKVTFAVPINQWNKALG